METQKSLRLLLEDAASQLAIYRAPGLDELQEPLNAILEAAGLGSTGNDQIDKIEEVCGTEGYFRITTVCSARGGRKASEFQLPVAIVDAEEPMVAAQDWAREHTVAELRATMAKAETAYCDARRRLQVLAPAKVAPVAVEGHEWPRLSNERIAQLFNPLDGAEISVDEMARRFARRIEKAVLAQAQPDLSLISQALDNPDAEASADICSDHAGQIDAFSWLPQGTKLYTETTVRALLVQAITMARPLEPIDQDVLPRVGSRVYIRHGRDNDAHACTVVGYYAWPGLGRNKFMYRLSVRLVYEGTDIHQARSLEDCYVSEEAALAGKVPVQHEPLLDWEVAHAMAYAAAAAFKPHYFNGPSFVADNWVVEAIRSAYLDGKRESAGLPAIDRQACLAPEDRLPSVSAQSPLDQVQ